MVKYYYDAWGNQIVSGSNTTLGNLNPFRYRGYFYDTDTGLYYLETRYYDPEVGRFINIDNIRYADPKTINGLNFYAYCGNNPVMYVDPLGHIFWLSPVLIGVVAVAMLPSSGHKKPVEESEIVADDININNKNPEGSINVSIGENGINIEDSYKITDKVDRLKILEIIMQSEEYNQYGYTRSIYSYQSEWQVHNSAYYLNIMPDHAADVYLNKEFTGFFGAVESAIYFLNMLIFD